MPRARNIKPGFFKNEELVELAFEYRLLFSGLWCLADREGRLEDRPKRIRMELFPADDVDCDEGLQLLHEAGQIVRYEVNGKRYIWIPAFTDHQKPHRNEADSVIPAYDTSAQDQGAAGDAPRAESEAPAEPSSDDHGATKDIPKADQGQTKECSARADCHDCLNPDSLNPESLQNTLGDISSEMPPPRPPDKRKRVPFQQIVDLYHETLPNLPRCEELTNARKGAIRQRHQENLGESLDNWRNFFEYVGESLFLTGRTEPRDGKRPFRANLEWITKQGNYVKIKEGQYHGG